MKLPIIDYKGKDAQAIARLVAHLCQLPNTRTVEEFKKAVFPTQRDNSRRVERIYQGGKSVGMYDDNTTPRWAILWSHDIVGGDAKLKGWRVAHVWNNCNTLQCYTRLENLLLVPAAYAGLTDDDGPLAPYLRYHAYDRYDEWYPEGMPQPTKPDDYDTFSNEWQYLDAAADSPSLVFKRLEKSGSERAEVLRDFIRDARYWDQPSGKT
jgi:hypothetical protein